MTDEYLYVADFFIISQEVPLPGEETQIKRNKIQVVLLQILLCTSLILFSSFHSSFTINDFVFRSLIYQWFMLPASEGWLLASSQRGHASHPGQSMRGLWRRKWYWDNFFRAPGFFPASIISHVFPLHIILIYSSCYKSSLISRWAPSFSHYMRTTAKYQYHKQGGKKRQNQRTTNFPAADLLSVKHSGFHTKISSLLLELEGLFQLSL